MSTLVSSYVSNAAETVAWLVPSALHAASYHKIGAHAAYVLQTELGPITLTVAH